MAETKVKINGKQNLDYKDLDLNDPRVLDSVELDRNSYLTGLLKSIFFTGIAILVFFIPMEINGETDVLFGYIYNFFVDALGLFGLWAVAIVIVVNGILSFYSTFLAKSESKVKNYYDGDSKVHPFLYLLGGFFIVVYSLDVTFSGFNGPEWLVSSAIGGTVVPSIVLGVAWIIPVGAFFMPFLLNYGSIDFCGALLEPFMRPAFKIPGSAAVDTLASFVSSSSVAVLITNRLYKSDVYTKKEACIIVTGFSAVSVGFAYMVISTAGLSEHFLKIYFIALILTFVITFIMTRIPPLSRKPSVYYSGKVQDEEIKMNKMERKENILKLGVDRAAKKAYTANSIFSEIKNSLKDGYAVFPKVLSLLTAIGISALIIAEYTPLFDWLGTLFIPLLKLFQVPNAAEIAPSMPIGIAEMFLPVLLIADKIELLDIGARYMVTTVSLVQLIFFSETIVVMMATKMPIKLRELIICFFERTIIAIPLAALCMHILF